MPSSSNLFKDSEHPFRWFLAPYVNIYFLIAENIDAYRNQKAEIKKWASGHNSNQRK